MTLKETLKQLKALGNAKVRAQNAKGGAGDNQFGVSLGDIRVLAKKIRTDHPLALSLWETGNVYAQFLPTLLIQPKKLSAASGSLVLLASGVLGCQRVESVTPVDDPTKTVVPSAFNGSKAGDEREVAGIKLCWCPPGRFTMGSPPGEPERRPGEDQVEVTLTKGFWMGKYEATQGQWKRVIGKLPGELTAELPEGDDFPVGNVNFAEAEAFCRKLTELGRQSGDLPKDWEFRLPTEAQWEYACRAGTTTATSFGDKLSSKQANFKGKPYNGAEPGPSLNRAAKVGSYPANAWGLHDMHGNIFEWCRDWYHAKLPGGTDPDLYAAKSHGNEEANTATSPGCAGAGAGPTTAGPAGRPFGCGSNRSGATTTSAFASSPFSRSQQEPERRLSAPSPPLRTSMQRNFPKFPRLHSNGGLAESRYPA